MGEDVDVFAESVLDPEIILDIRRLFPDSEFEIEMTHQHGRNSGFNGVYKDASPDGWTPHFSITLDNPRTIHVFFWGWDDRVIDPVLSVLKQRNITFTVD